MYTGKKKKLFTVFLALMLILQLLPLGTALAVTTSAGTYIDLDGTSLVSLATSDISVTKDNSPVSPDGDGHYAVDENTDVSLTLQFSLAMDNGDEDNYVPYAYDGSEYFTVPLPADLSFVFSNLSSTIEIKKGGTDTVFATATIAGDGKNLTVQLNPNIEGMQAITGSLTLNGNFSSLDGKEDGQYSYTIGDTTIIVDFEQSETPPVDPGMPTLSKVPSYNAETNKITWTVVITPPNTDYDLRGFTFTDTLTSGNHSYDTDSFRLSSDPEATASFSSTSFTYTFPSGDTPITGTQTITYDTIPSVGTATALTNEAKLTNSDSSNTVTTTGSYSMSAFFGKAAIAGYPNAVEPHVIKWKITVNIPEASDGETHLLPNARILDALGPHLSYMTDVDHPMEIDFGDGIVHTISATDGDYGHYEINGEDPSQLTYFFPNTQPATGKTVTFTYYTEVTDWNAFADSNDAVEAKNTAQFQWGGDGSGSGPTWTVGSGEVTKGLVNSNGLISKATTNAANFDHSAASSTIIGDYILWTVTVNTNKINLGATPYIADFLPDNAGHKMVLPSDTYPITVNGTAYTTPKSGDASTWSNELGFRGLSDTGFTFDFLMNTNTTYTITFYTIITNQGTLYKNTAGTGANPHQTYTNNVTLNYGTAESAKSATTSATKTYRLQMLDKANGSYNIADKTASWTLVINRNRLPLTDLTLADTLPEGMSVYPTDGSGFEVYINGSTDKQTLTDAGLTYTNTTSGGDRHSFTLTRTTETSTSDQYKIVYKTLLSDAYLKDSTKWTNNQLTFTNEALLTATEIDSEGVPEFGSVTITNKPIDKSYSGYKAGDDSINWTIKINPTHIMLENGTVEDQLPVGTALSLDGGLNSSNGITLYEIGSSGNTPITLSAGTANPTDSTTAVYSYDPDTRMFIVYLPQNTDKEYELKFRTDITDFSQKSIENKMSLKDGAEISSDTKSNISVSEITAIGGYYTNSIIVKKLGSDNRPVVGAKYELYLKNDGTGNPIKRYTQSGLETIVRETIETVVGEKTEALATFESIPRRTYYVKETYPGYGYLLPTENSNLYKESTVVGSNNSAVSFTNTLYLAEVVITKVGDSGTLLSDGQFGLYKVSDNSEVQTINVNNGSSDASKKGKVIFTNVPFGEYYIKEIIAPAGHEADTSKKIYVTVGYAKNPDGSYDYTKGEEYYSSNGTTWSTDSPNFVNMPKTGKDGNPDITFAKYKNDGAGSSPLAGATFELRKGGTVESTITTDSTGIVTFSSVGIGTYEIWETNPTAGYLSPGKIFTVEVKYNSTNSALVVVIKDLGGNDVTSTASYTNQLGKASVSVKKIGAKDGVNDVPLPGAKFTLTGYPDAFPTLKYVYETEASGADGTATFTSLTIYKKADDSVVTTKHPVTDVLMGTYTLHESAVPTNHTAGADKTVKVEWSNTDKSAVKVTFSGTDGNMVKNSPNPIDVSFTKADSADSGKKLSGGTYELRGTDYTGKPITKSNEPVGTNGKVVFKDVNVGSYDIYETSPPNGYLLNTGHGLPTPKAVLHVVVTYDKTGGDIDTQNSLVFAISLPAGAAAAWNAGTGFYANTLGLAPVQITKKGANGVILSGGTFTLTGTDYSGKNNYSIVRSAADGTGLISFGNLPIGDYTITETTSPTGHGISGPINVKIAYNPAKTALTVTYGAGGVGSDVLANAPTPTTVSFSKLDKDLTTRIPVNGTFELWGWDYTQNRANPATKHGTASVSGGTVTFSNVTIGTYEVYEIQPPDGYLLNNGLPASGLPTKILDVVVDYVKDGSGNVTNTTRLVVTITDPTILDADKTTSSYANTLGEHDVEIKKVGASSTPLTDGVFTLYKYSGNSVVKIATVNNGVAVPANKGQVLFKDIPIGDYYIQETSAPSGHIADSTKIYVRVDYTDATLTAVQATYSNTYNPVGTGYTTTIPIFTNVPINSGISGNPDVSFKKLRVDQLGGTKTPLGGVTFTLKDKTGILPDATATSDSNGIVTFTDVAFGKYIIFETVPDGYLNPNADPANAPIYTVDVSYNTGATGLKVRLFAGINNTYLDADALYDSEAAAVPLHEHINVAAVADVEFMKLSTTETDPSSPKTKINGGTFEIRGKAIAGYPTEAGTGDYVDTATAVDGKVTFKNVPVNATGERYTIKEITPPSSYFATTDTLTVKVSYADSTNIAVASPVYWDKDDVSMASPSLGNMPIPYNPGEGKVTVLKTDEGGKPLAGATFTLYNATGGAMASMVSGTDGLAVFEKLPPDSSYTIRETAAPAGYELSTQVLSFRTGDKSVLSFTMVNKKLLVEAGAISVLKTDEAGKALGGAEFTLYDKDGKALDTRVTGADGKLLFDKLPVGSYTIVETRAPLGYILDSTGRTVAVAKDQTQALTVVNRRQETPNAGSGRLQLVKVDSDYRPLAGAEFTLYTSDGNVFAKMTTGSDGRVTFTELPAGKYTVRETIAPNGYQLFTEGLPIEVLANGTSLSYTLTDAALGEDEEVMGWEDNGSDKGNNGGKLPQTGGASPTFFVLLAGIALVATGLVLMRGEKYRPKHLKRK